MGKDKVSAAPHLDGGDFVVVVNAEKLITTGTKSQQKTYWRHSGFPGGLHKRQLNEQLAIDSRKVIEHAVRGMLPDNKLRRSRLKRLKIYADDQHQHHAQNPQELEQVKK
jgi:large subunit ribosomal protein L13